MHYGLRDHALLDQYHPKDDVVALAARPSLLALSLALAAILGAAGCGSDSKKSDNAAASSASSAAASASPTASTAGSGSAADPATATAVSAAVVKLFDGTAPTAQRLAVLQGGDVLAQSLGDAINSPVLKLTSATVSKVTLVSPNQAQVTYTLSLSGAPILKDTIGTAVKVDGSWKVSAATLCGLLTAQGAAPAACSQASVTALPS
jgi:hypothetical protein